MGVDIHIIPNLKIGGGEAVLTKLVKELSKTNDKVYIYLFEDIIDFEFDGMCVLNSDQFSVLLKTNSCHIFLWYYKSVLVFFRFPLLLYLSFFRTKNRFYLMIRQNVNFAFDSILTNILKIVCSLLSHVIFKKIVYVTDQSRFDHENNLFYNRNIGYVLTNGFPTCNFELSIRSNELKKIAWIGRSHRVKNFELFIRFINTSQSVFGKCEIIVYGSNFSQNCIAGFNNLENVKIIFNSKVDYKKIDCVILTSFSEGFSNVLSECIINGIPFVSVPLPYLDDILLHKNGFLSKSYDPIDLLESYLLLSNLSREEMNEKLIHNYHFFIQKYSIVKFIETYNNLKNE